MSVATLPTCIGGFRESNSGPLAPEASIMPLNQIPVLPWDADSDRSQFIIDKPSLSSHLAMRTIRGLYKDASFDEKHEKVCINLKMGLSKGLRCLYESGKGSGSCSRRRARNKVDVAWQRTNTYFTCSCLMDSESAL